MTPFAQPVFKILFKMHQKEPEDTTPEGSPKIPYQWHHDRGAGLQAVEYVARVRGPRLREYAGRVRGRRLGPHRLTVMRGVSLGPFGASPPSKPDRGIITITRTATSTIATHGNQTSNRTAT